MKAPTILLSTFVLGAMITNLRSKYLLVKVDGISESKIAGGPQIHWNKSKGKPLRSSLLNTTCNNSKNITK